MHIKCGNFCALQYLLRNHEVIVEGKDVIRCKRLKLRNEAYQFICIWCDVWNIFLSTRFGHTPKPNIFIGIILMGDYEINLYAGAEKRIQAINAYIVISKDDCVQLFFL